MKQEVYAGLDSIRVTAMVGSSLRRYLAAVQPPTPPPMTTTRRAAPKTKRRKAQAAQAAAAPAARMKVLRFRSVMLLSPPPRYCWLP
jgi:hypothetical protein